MSLVVSIDGACRRNGKPNCIAAGGVFIQQYVDGTCELSKALSNYEIKSTNQRGELLALITALDYIWSAKQSAMIVTDSEYIFNAMTKEWYKGWISRGWKTAMNEPVKNSDLWRAISQAHMKCVDDDVEIIFYHIKGHCIPFGKVTASSLLSNDNTGALLYEKALEKYDAVSTTTRASILMEAEELSIRNNGFRFDTATLRRFVALNTVADAVATKCVEAADVLYAV